MQPVISQALASRTPVFSARVGGAGGDGGGEESAAAAEITLRLDVAGTMTGLPGGPRLNIVHSYGLWASGVELDTQKATKWQHMHMSSRGHAACQVEPLGLFPWQWCPGVLGRGACLTVLSVLVDGHWMCVSQWILLTME